jgi:hypothetical protein
MKMRIVRYSYVEEALCLLKKQPVKIVHLNCHLKCIHGGHQN